MKKIVTRLLIVTFLIGGLALMLYPVISNMLAERYHIDEIENYDEIIEEMDAQVKEEELQKAKEYNDALTGSGIEDPFMPGSGTVLPENYTSVLDLNNGVMGYIEIPEINVYLPVYHGTSENVLRKGVGHMEYTAFPIGGEGNHTVLTGHTGLPSAMLFTDLDELETGDVFYITVLDTKLAYEIDQILVVTPEDTSDLLPVPGEDYVTLVTCTPYGINSHRLLVRGTRIPYEETQEQEVEAFAVNWYAVSIVLIAVITAVTYVIYRFRRKRNRRVK